MPNKSDKQTKTRGHLINPQKLFDLFEEPWAKPSLEGPKYVLDTARVDVEA